MLQEIAERIKALPPLPKSFHSISVVCNNPESSVHDLAKIVEEDPMLVANLLKVANSPLYGFRREIRNVLQAISLFGMSTTRSLVTDMSIKKLLNVDMEPYNVTPEVFAQISSWQSALMMRWYKKVNPAMGETLFLSSLLQETGKILIADEVVKNDETYQFKSEISNSSNIASVERMFVGVSSADITALIFEHWKFDALMVESIRFSDNYESAPEDIRPYALALKIVKTALPLNAPFSERSIALALHILAKEEMDDAPFMEALNALKEHC